MRVLVSGFEPFLEEKINPSAEIVRFVNSLSVGELSGIREIRGVVLPVLFDEAFQILERERLAFRPDIILSFGLAGGRTTFDIEQVAVNLRGSGGEQRPDNSGVVGRGAIDQAAPLSLQTTLPVDAILEGLRDAGIPARESFSAGTYVCNDLFFQMQNRLRFTRVRSGFIHVPRLAQTSDAEGDAWLWSRFEIATRAILGALTAKAFLPNR